MTTSTIKHVGLKMLPLIDESGDVKWAGQYSAFGEVTVIVNDVMNNFRFPGQYWDDETGLYYNFHRYYSAEIGRYFREDTIGFDGGINLFVYVQNNPVNSLDPLGLWRLPDYISLNINIAIPTPWTGTLFGWSGQITLDRYGNLYWAPLGVSGGKSLTGVSGSLTTGWLNECEKPSEERLKGFLSDIV